VKCGGGIAHFSESRRLVSTYCSTSKTPAGACDGKVRGLD